MAADVNALDLLNRVDSFYQSSFNILMAVLAIGLAVTGIVIPLIISWQQQRAFKKTEEKFEAQLESKTNAFKDELNKAIADYEQKLTQTELKIENQSQLLQHKITADIYFHLALNRSGLDLLSLPYALESALESARANQINEAKTTLDMAIEILKDEKTFVIDSDKDRFAKIKTIFIEHAPDKVKLIEDLMNQKFNAKQNKK